MIEKIQKKDKEDYIDYISSYVASLIINRYEVLGSDIKETYEQIFNSACDEFRLSKTEYEEIYNNVDLILGNHNPKLIIATKRDEPIYLVNIEEVK